MDLVQDAASPAHARNDPHVFFNYETAIDGLRIREASTFERWRDGTPDAAGVPDPGWRSLDGNPLAPIAIARLVDTDRYTGTNPSVTIGALIGLAEYTNANFFSEDRIFTENGVNPQTQFPFPRRSSVVEQDVDVQVGGATVKRRYLIKNADGATGYRIATVGFLREYHRRSGLDLARLRETPAPDPTLYPAHAEPLRPVAVDHPTPPLHHLCSRRLAAP